MASRTERLLDPIDHIALAVPNVKEAVDWYTANFQCSIEYQDATWAFLRFRNIKLALVVPNQHPPHICFVSNRAADFGKLKRHRDGTSSCYVKDAGGNAVEIMEPYEDAIYGGSAMVDDSEPDPH